MNNLKKKILNYDIIIFDLDDTIYSQKDYDNPALLHVSKYLAKIIKKDKNIIFKKLRALKKIRRGLGAKPVFDIFLKDYKNINKKKIISSCISLFQNYECKELKRSKSLRILLKSIYKHVDCSTFDVVTILVNKVIAKTIIVFVVFILLFYDDNLIYFYRKLCLYFLISISDVNFA